EDGIRDLIVTGVQTCALPISVPTFALPAAAYALARKPLPRELPAVQANNTRADGQYWTDSEGPAMDFYTVAAVAKLGLRASNGRSEERRVGKECRSRWGGSE